MVRIFACIDLLSRILKKICFIDLSQKNPFYSILPEATLLSAVEEFALGTHRGMICGVGIICMCEDIKRLFYSKILSFV